MIPVNVRYKYIYYINEEKNHRTHITEVCYLGNKGLLIYRAEKAVPMNSSLTTAENIAEVKEYFTTISL